jgi:hypothetical protein
MHEVDGIQHQTGYQSARCIDAHCALVSLYLCQYDPSSRVSGIERFRNADSRNGIEKKDHFLAEQFVE